MKIAVISKVNNPIAEPFAGGLESFTYMICKEYMRQGHEVTLYANESSDSQFNIISFNNPEAFNSKVSDQYEADEYHKIVNHIDQSDYDIVHNNSTHPIPIIWGARAKIPVVSSLHTPPYSSLKAIASIASHSNNLKFVAVSKSLKKSWQPFIHTDVSVIHNGIKLDDWISEEHTTDTPYLFWYGRIIHNKGLDIALELAHLLKIPLRFAGPYSDQNYYDKTIKPLIQSTDSYLGHLNQKSINTHLRGAKALINSGRWEEPFGLSTIEALASGTPVIGFDRGALREIISNEGGVIADGTTIGSLKEAYLKLKNLKPELIVERSIQFNIQKSATQYLDYFEEIK